MWISENKKLVDNIIYFRHFKHPELVIKNPNCIIQITALDSNNVYVYGSYIEPDKNEIVKFLQDAMYSLGEYELFKFDTNKFKIKIKKRVYTRNEN